jgi:dynein heavy chain
MIGQLPLICPPSIYGFHENGNLTKDIKETEDLCNSLLCVTGGRTASDNEDSQGEKKLKEICQDILSKFPKKFDLELV